MKKEERKVASSDPNNFGVWSLIIGMFSVVSSPIPLIGFILAIAGFFLSSAQEKREKNSWSKAGKILSIIGAVLSVLSYLLALWISKNPELIQQIYGGTYGI